MKEWMCIVPYKYYFILLNLNINVIVYNDVQLEKHYL